MNRESFSLFHQKEVAYKTLVRPKQEYAAPIWSPYCKTQIRQVEKEQRTAAHWTCRRWRNTSSVSEMLDELQWPTLEIQRDQFSLLSSTRFIAGLCLLVKTVTWSRLREHTQFTALHATDI